MTPTLSHKLADLETAAGSAAFTAELQKHGYSILWLPDIECLVTELRTRAADFFQLSPDAKRSACADDDVHAVVGREGVGYRTQPEHESEFVETFLRLDNGSAHPAVRSPPRFAAVLGALHSQLTSAGRTLLHILAADLGLPAAALIDEPLALWQKNSAGDAARSEHLLACCSSSLLRVCHYHAALDADAEEKETVLFPEHADSTMITLAPLCPDAPGLQLRAAAATAAVAAARGGGAAAPATQTTTWIDVDSLPGATPGHVLVQAGDYLDILSRGRFRATRHRVVRPAGAAPARYSCPLLMRPRDEWRRGRGWLATRGNRGQRRRERGGARRGERRLSARVER